MNNIEGSIVALVTPMQKKSARIDYNKFAELITWHIEQGTSGIVVAGSTGEAATLESKEWIKLLEIAKNTATGSSLSIIAGTGTNCTKSTIKKTLLAEKIGVDASLIVTPYYNKPTQEGLTLHFNKIAAKTNLPIILYNVPSRTACDLLPATVVELAKLPNIIGIKEATGKLERVVELKKLCKEKFILLSGDDASFVEFMLLGGHGVISVTANIVPSIINKICNLILTKNPIHITTAKQLNNKLDGLHKMLMIESNPIPVKWLLAYMGKIQQCYRLPLTNLSKQHHSAVLDAYKNVENINIELMEGCNL